MTTFLHVKQRKKKEKKRMTESFTVFTFYSAIPGNRAESYY